MAVRIPTAGEIAPPRVGALNAPRLPAPVPQRDQFADALTEIGQIGEKTAMAYVRRDEQRRIEGENLVVAQELHDANQWANDLTVKAKTRQGVNAFGVREEYMKDLNAEIEKRAGKFTDPRMATAFKSGALSITGRADSFLAGHEKEEHFKAQKDTLSTGIRVEAENALRAFQEGDPDGFGVAALESGMRKKRELAVLEGLDKDGQDLAAFDFRSGILAARVTDLVPTNPGQARALFESVDKAGFFSAKDRQALDAKTKATSEENAASQAANALVDGYRTSGGPLTWGADKEAEILAGIATKYENDATTGDKVANRIKATFAAQRAGIRAQSVTAYTEFRAALQSDASTYEYDMGRKAEVVATIATTDPDAADNFDTALQTIIDKKHDISGQRQEERAAENAIRAERRADVRAEKAAVRAEQRQEERDARSEAKNQLKAKQQIEAARLEVNLISRFDQAAQGMGAAPTPAEVSAAFAGLTAQSGLSFGDNENRVNAWIKGGGAQGALSVATAKDVFRRYTETKPDDNPTAFAAFFNRLKGQIVPGMKPTAEWVNEAGARILEEKGRTPGWIWDSETTYGAALIEGDEFTPAIPFDYTPAQKSAVQAAIEDWNARHPERPMDANNPDHFRIVLGKLGGK